MSKVPRPLFRFDDGQTDILERFGEDRESFTQTFAYDNLQWPAFKIFGHARPSVIDNRTPKERAAEERGLEGQDSSDNGPAAPYTTTNSAIPIYTTGKVVQLDDSATILPQTSLSGPVIGLDDYRADDRFNDFNGAGQAVVILDTGIDLDDPFFGPDADGNGVADRIVYQYDFADNDANAGDVDGHGSNVASIAAGAAYNYLGMAPHADIIALKVFSDSGTGYFSDIEESLQWVVDNAAAYNIVSVNMSLGDGGNYNAPVALYGIADELATLAAMDVIVVSASGNGFYELNSVQGVAYPSADANSLSVGAVYDADTGGWSYGSGAIAYTTAADRIAPFSQRDDAMSDIFAPGAEIIGAGAGNALTSMHGTSQAAPHIAGIVALAQQLAVAALGRRLTYDEFNTLLSASADIVIDGDDENDNVANTGLAFPRVNVAKLADAILEMAWPGAETFFDIATPEVVKAEGNSQVTGYTFTIHRSGDTSSTGSVDFAVTGSGSNPVSADDFNGGILPSGTLTFFEDQTVRVVTVYASTDTDYEDDETFTISLSNPSAGSGFIRSSASGTILNDDLPDPGVSIALVDAGFDSDSGGFTYAEGVFGGANPQVYADGAWQAGALTIELGGI
ncbi:MAG: S8 family serine peptidase, partial [Kiloniellaceae bacterium]